MSKQFHKLPEPASWLGSYLSAESCVYWARGEADRCVIFVHGYGGRAVTTWGDFPLLATTDPAFANADLLFLGYDSLLAAAYSTSVLLPAIDTFVSATSESKAIGRPPRGNDFRYKRILLVGHSLGGALVRDVAVTAAYGGKIWAEDVCLALFAPAHKGAIILKIAALAGGFARAAGTIAALGVRKSPALEDLKPDSDYLKDLQRRSANLGKRSAAMAAFVAHAADDRVVFANAFSEFDAATSAYGKVGHRGCCKPVPVDFMRPVTDVGQLL
ncbi:hypothetical protein [Rhizobium sp. BR 314]|uniref:hypothetical protein n=1 Tax=Rhizobium sp. BR 314 TaxID=3040013 RepID=UPI0039BF1912